MSRIIQTSNSRSAALRFCSGVLLLLAVVGVEAVRADVVLDFEGFPDSTILTTQYPGVSFTNAVILSAGISLNEFEFPPRDGVNVVSDNGGPMTIDFASPITSFGGYFTYLEPLTLAGFNSSKVEVASGTAAFSTNDALFGDAGSSPNEFIQLGSAVGISTVTITGDLAGGSFVLDDVTYRRATTPIPEPGTALLLAIVILFSIRLKTST